MKLLIVFVLFCVQSVHGQVGDGSGITTADSLAAKCKDKCVTQMCYLADENDCRRYIQCDGTTGNYTGVIKPCAPGTLWAGKQVDPKISCDLPQNVKCNIEYCVGKSDGEKFGLDDSNCRMYHTCKKQKELITHCCDENQSFDTTQNKCVVDENCKDRCPLKKDACESALVQNTTAPLDDDNCRTFWECGDKNPLPTCCEKGHGYDKNEGKCMPSGCNDDCAYNDQCEKGVDKYAIYTDYCGTFMQCNKTSGNKRSCCQSGFKFDPKINDCVESKENDTCVDDCPSGYKYFCPLKADSSNTSKYITVAHDTETTMACAPGALFQLDTCGCSIMVEAPDNSCNMELDIAFDGPNMVRTGAQNMTKITVYGTLTTSTGPGEAAVFDGKTRLESAFTQQSFDAFYLLMKFIPKNVGNSRYVLASNCIDRNLDKATLDLSLTGGMVKLEVVTNQASVSGTSANYLEVPFQTNVEQTTTAIYKDGMLHLGVQGPGGAEAVSRNLTGKVTVAGKGLEFGGCGKKGEDETTEAGFDGDIAKMQFSKCVTDKWIKDFDQTFNL